MNKYELAVVLSAKLEDDERTAALEKVKDYIVRFGGTVTDVDEWGRGACAYHGAGHPLSLRKTGSYTCQAGREIKKE